MRRPIGEPRRCLGATQVKVPGYSRSMSRSCDATERRVFRQRSSRGITLRLEIETHMQMNKVALMASAGFGMAFLAACSDSPTAPSKAAFVPKSSFAVGALTDATPQLGVVKICKEGNIGGSFDVSRVAIGGSTGTVSGDNTLIDNGQCKIVAEDQSGSGVGSEVFV